MNKEPPFLLNAYAYHSTILNYNPRAYRRLHEYAYQRGYGFAVACLLVRFAEE